MFFTASVLPVAVGTIAGARHGGAFDGGAFALALTATVCVHAAVNVYNDVCDSRSGGDQANLDRIHPFTGGSRFIQNGVLGEGEMARLAHALLGVGVLLGVALVALKGPMVLALGAIGVGLGLLYSLPPVHLAGRGLGEIAVGIGFGVLPVVGAAWLQAGSYVPLAALLSLPLGCWIAAVLIANEVPDAVADEGAGKRTLAVRLGPRGTRVLYAGVQAAAAASLAGGVSLDVLPAWSLVVPVALLGLAGIAAKDLGGSRLDLTRAIKLTLAIHLAGGLWLCLLAAVAGG
jgi:1,4-dihydroxy-2-naphthoate octaprenyltransferase